MIVTPEAERFGEEQRRLSEQAQARESHTGVSTETEETEGACGEAASAKAAEAGQARGRREHLQTCLLYTSPSPRD